MINNSKLKLTTWYILILAVITISFSAIIYIGTMRVTRNAINTQKQKIEKKFRDQPNLPQQFKNINFLDDEMYNEVSERTILTLAIINIAILSIAALLAYFLAQKTLDPIEQMLEKQKKFISTASHDLKTPLTAIKADIEVTLRNKSLTLIEAKNTLESTIEEINSLAKFINRLLDKSKYQNADIKGNFKTVDLKIILEDVIKRVNSIANTKNIILNYDLKDINIIGDDNSLSELFMNIIDNAIKFSPNNAVVEVKTYIEKNFSVTKIKDQGDGISNENLNNIFEPFFTTSESRNKAEANGFGLGLSIAKEITDLHNGKIKVKSKIHDGTSFYIYLPLKNSNRANIKY